MTAPTASPDVCVINDDLGVRSALASLFRSARLTVSSHGSIDSFLAAGASDTPGCLVLDIGPAGQGGIDCLFQLPSGRSAIPFILVTEHGDVRMTVQAMRAGAANVLCKPFSDTDMLTAVTVALEADRIRRQQQARHRHLQERFATLTLREREILGLVTAGLMNKQIAGRLGLSEITIKTHRGRVMRKLQASSLADLVRMAETLGARDRSATRRGSKAA